MDWLLSHTDHLFFLCATVGTQPFTDFDFANNNIGYCPPDRGGINTSIGSEDN